MHFDTTGKVSFGHLYSQPDPRPYFAALREFGYQLPQLAKPYFAKLIAEFEQSEHLEEARKRIDELKAAPARAVSSRSH